MSTDIKILKSLESYWNWNKETLDRISRLKNCKQSKIHHAEGDVYVHTQMVVEQMKLVTEKPILILSAILHDIAKPDTTSIDKETNDWISPGHAKLGEKIVRELLFGQLSFTQREEIAALVRFHGLPIWFSEKENPDMSLIKASLRCNIKELALLAECDFKGRICQDLDEMLLRIEIFKEKAENLNCLDKSYTFTSDWARMHYFYNGGYPGKEIWEPKGGWLTIMCGLSGSGKNTWLRKNHSGKIVELDAIRKELKIPHSNKDGQGTVIQEAKERLKVSLRKGEDVAWNATSLTEMQRAPIIELGMTYGAKIKLVYMDCDAKKSIARNKEREEKEMIPEASIERMYKKLEIPNLTECHKLEIVN